MFEEKLIRSVKKHQELYNKWNADYRNRTKRDKAWEIIAKEVGITMEQCKGRWRTLKDRFMKDYNKADTGNVSNQPKVKWRFHDSMSFLKDYVVPKQNLLKVECVMIEEADEKSSSTPPESPRPTSPAARPLKRKSDSEDSLFYEAMMRLTDIVERKIDEEEKDDSFEKFLCSMIKKVSPQQQETLKIEIINFTKKQIDGMLNE